MRRLPEGAESLIFPARIGRPRNAAQPLLPQPAVAVIASNVSQRSVYVVVHMRRVVGIVVVFALLVAACGSDAVDSATTCTELTRAWEHGDQPHQESKDKVLARAIDLAGNALARGSEAEAIVCGLVASEAGALEVEEIFADNPDLVEGRGQPPIGPWVVTCNRASRLWSASAYCGADSDVLDTLE